MGKYEFVKSSVQFLVNYCVENSGNNVNLKQILETIDPESTLNKEELMDTLQEMETKPQLKHDKALKQFTHKCYLLYVKYKKQFGSQVNSIGQIYCLLATGSSICTKTKEPEEQQEESKPTRNSEVPSPPTADPPVIEQPPPVEE